MERTGADSAELIGFVALCKIDMGAHKILEWVYVVLERDLQIKTPYPHHMEILSGGLIYIYGKTHLNAAEWFNPQ